MQILISVLEAYVPQIFLNFYHIHYLFAQKHGYKSQTQLMRQIWTGQKVSKQNNQEVNEESVTSSTDKSVVRSYLSNNVTS